MTGRIILRRFASYRQCLQTEGTDAKRRRVIVLFSAVKEKDYREMIHLICREIPADLFVVTQISASVV